MSIQPNVGMILGKYRLERELGRGGMASVWLARHIRLETYFAVKILDTAIVEKDAQYVKRFLREARLASKIHHPHLVGVYDVDQDSATGLYYLVMEYVPGGNVSQRIAKKGALSEKEALHIIHQITEALCQAGTLGMVHRDIKPDNIMFGEHGDAKLADLGIAKADNGEESTLTQTSAIFGTPAYMSPEQAADSGKVDARADIYSLGVVFYEMLTGKRPYGGKTVMEILAKIIDKTPPPDLREHCPHISEATANLVRVMMNKDASQRPGSAAELLARLNRLETALGERSLGTETMPTMAVNPDVTMPTMVANMTQPTIACNATIASPLPQKTKKKVSSRQWVLIGLSGVVLFLIGLIIFTKPSETPSSPPQSSTPPIEAPNPPNPSPSTENPNKESTVGLPLETTVSETPTPPVDKGSKDGSSMDKNPEGEADVPGNEGLDTPIDVIEEEEPAPPPPPPKEMTLYLYAGTTAITSASTRISQADKKPEVKSNAPYTFTIDAGEPFDIIVSAGQQSNLKWSEYEAKSLSYMQEKRIDLSYDVIPPPPPPPKEMTLYLYAGTKEITSASVRISQAGKKPEVKDNAPYQFMMDTEKPFDIYVQEGRQDKLIWQAYAAEALGYEAELSVDLPYEKVKPVSVPVKGFHVVSRGKPLTTVSGTVYCGSERQVFTDLATVDMPSFLEAFVGVDWEYKIVFENPGGENHIFSPRLNALNNLRFNLDTGSIEYSEIQEETDK